MRIAREGYGPSLLVALASIPAWLLGWGWLAWGLLATAAAVLLFFRDPERTVPTEPDLVVAPADGRVVEVQTVPSGDAGPVVRVSIFLSLFNVHINRSPVAGRVTDVRYHSGSFLPAFRDKASLQNEQNRIELESDSVRLAVVQIAGWVARRIVCRARAGDWLDRGQRLGLIKFGSRVDLYLPETIELHVRVGDRVRGGSSVIGRLQ